MALKWGHFHPYDTEDKSKNEKHFVLILILLVLFGIMFLIIKGVS